MICRNRSTISRLPARWVSAPSPRRQKPQQQHVGRPADDGVGVGRRGRRRRRCRPRRGRSRRRGRCRRSGRAAPRPTSPVSVTSIRRWWGSPWKLPHAGTPPYMTPSTSSMPSVARAGSSGEGVAGGQLGVDPVDQRLVGLAAEREADRLLGSPASTPRRPGRRRASAATSAAERSSYSASRSSYDVGPLGLLVAVAGVLRPVADDPRPEVLHLAAEVPEQVGRVPVGAARHAARPGRSRPARRGSGATRSRGARGTARRGDGSWRRT